jgi:hypothetical protein
VAQVAVRGGEQGVVWEYHDDATSATEDTESTENGGRIG